MDINIPEPYRIDTKPFIQRPFFVGEVDYPATAARFTKLNTGIESLPGDIIRSNESLLSMFKIGAYGRPDLILNLSLAGTISHSGCLLVGIIPPMPKAIVGTKGLINTIMSGPHGFLFANEATSLAIPVPWYCNSDLATLDMENSPGYVNSLDLGERKGNYATLVILVLNQLAPSTGSTTSLKIVIEACFKNCDIVVPTPRYLSWFAQGGVTDTIRKGVTGLLDYTSGQLKTVSADLIDQARKAVRLYTGLHNPAITHIPLKTIVHPLNYPNVTDREQYFEKLDPFSTFDRMVTQPIFNTYEDEMLISHVVKKKQYIGTFDVHTADPVGTILWVRPISPFQGGYTHDEGSVYGSNNIELMHSIHRGWSGNLKITIQSVMNNKQQCKLKVIKYYNPSMEALDSYPVYQTISNAPSHLMEFTQGGQNQEVLLPFLSRNAIMPCSPNMDVEPMMHGLYYVYLAQPLVVADSSPTTISFNVYMEGGDDLTFYGYAFNKMIMENFDFVPQGGIRVMNEPQQQDNTLRSDPDTGETTLSAARLMPICDMRSHIRRMYSVRGLSFDVQPGATSKVVTPLSALIGECISFSFDSPIEWISRMYYGKSPGFKLRVKVASLLSSGSPYVNEPIISRLDIRFLYFPQVVNIQTGVNRLTAANTGNNIPVFSQNNPWCVPIPFTSSTLAANTQEAVYEFVVPNTSFFKYIGSPDKFLVKNGGATDFSPASDCGSVIAIITNRSIDRTERFHIEFYAGLTDESRLGYHTIAPVYRLYKADGYVLGNNSSPISAVSSVPNKYTYFPTT